MDKMEDFRILWRRYIDYYVVGNKELKEMVFNNIIGILLTVRNNGYIESARKMSTRYHVFSFQKSGTGKGETMKAANKLLQALAIPSRYTMKDNEACASGTVYMDRVQTGKKVENKVQIRKGVLSHLFAYYWDEGGLLVEPGSYMSELQEDFMGVMDEPGWISKGMRLGTVGYPSNASIMAGTYKVPELKKGLLEKGLLQRMGISYKTFSAQELKNIRIGIGMLKMNTSAQRVEDLIEALKKFCNNLPTNKWITFEREAIEQYNIIMEQIYREYIEGNYTGLKQDILETFFNRFHLLIDKVAAQRALVNNRLTVGYEDIIYSIDRNRWHLDSVLRIFDIMGREVKISVDQQRRRSIINIISGAGGKIDKRELKEKLHELYEEGQWELGINRTLTLIENMVKDKTIHEVSGDKNRKIIILK